VDVRPTGRAQAVMCNRWRSVSWQLGVSSQAWGAVQASKRKSPTACLVTPQEMEEAGEGKYITRLHSITHLYGLAPAACCSVVMMGFRSCFLFFWPEATFLAFSIAAFLMPSEPFMVRRLVDWSACVGLY
jgi:hypothetical protein